MIPMLGRAVIRARSVQIRPLISLTSKASPFNSVNVTRAMATHSANHAEADLMDIHSKKTLKTAIPTEKGLISTIDHCKTTGDVREAIMAVQRAEEFGLATPELYQQLLDLLRTVPFDREHSAVVAYWFYSTKSTVSPKVMNDIAVWKSMLKLAFHFGNTYRSEDLRALLVKFSETFNLEKMNDQEAWELLIRGWGILGKSGEIQKHFDILEKNAKDKTSFYENALIAFALVGSNDKEQEIFSILKQTNALSHNILERLTRIYAFKGDVQLTAHYKAVIDELYQDHENKSMLLIAHKVALGKIAERLANTRGSRGLHLKPQDTPEIDSLHTSWEALTKDMLKDNQPVDITDCNIMLEYLITSHYIDPLNYPMEKAESLFEDYMSRHGIKPNEASYHIMMQGYATSRQYKIKNGRSERLDKTLEIVSKMQDDGIRIDNYRTFHTLFRACIPYGNGQYYFDNFKSTSILPHHARRSLKVDARLFDIEKIMLDAHIPHDRFTFSTFLTCLAAGGQFKSFYNRWNTFRLHGFSPDIAMYRHVFALSALDAKQSRNAIRQIKQDMERDITKKKRNNFALHCAMLDCCITAQLPQEAKDIIQSIQGNLKTAQEKQKRGQDNEHWPEPNDPKVYSAILRASTLIRGLNANQVIREMNEKEIEYNQDIWETLLSKYALEKDYKNVRRLFNKYTMSRFAQNGNIPIPVRDTSPMIPFPSAPYNTLDMEFINVYLGTLVDTQNISLVFDVLRTWSEQTNDLSINRTILAGAIKLAKQENDIQDLKWLSTKIMPKSTENTKQFRRLQQHVNHFIQKQ